MSGRGLGSAYLWNLKRGQERLEKALEAADMDLMKALGQYNKDVCAYCRQVYCEPEKELECYRNFTRD